MPEYYHPVDDALLRFLDDLARSGIGDDPRQTARPGTRDHPIRARSPAYPAARAGRATGAWASA